MKDAKRSATLKREKSAKLNWLAHLGPVRLNEITKANLNSYLAKRQLANIGARTLNREMIALRNTLKRAQEDSYLKTLPMENLRPLKTDECK